MLKLYIAFDKNDNELMSFDSDKPVKMYVHDGQQAFDYMPHGDYRRCAYLKIWDGEKQEFKPHKYLKEKYL